MRRPCTDSSAGLCLLHWLSSGWRDVLGPPERLRALLMLQETRCAGCMAQPALNLMSWNIFTSALSLRQHFSVLHFVSFYKFLVWWLPPPLLFALWAKGEGRRGESHHTKQTGETFFWSFCLQPIITLLIWINMTDAEYRDTFWKAACLHNELYSQRSLLRRFWLHWMTLLLRTMCQRKKPLEGTIMGRISAAVTPQDAISTFSSAVRSDCQFLRAGWQWVL